VISVVVGLFGPVIGSFLNVVVHRVALRMRDIKVGGMLETFLGPCAVLRVFLGAFLEALVGGS
jgi:prepilin signal peptidase PulO-like enzyme (type II secretory pathway)